MKPSKWTVALLVLLAGALTASSAFAWGRSRVFIGFNFGFPGYWPAPYYYYPPPPAYYVPAPVATGPQCREWRGDALNEQTGQPFYGTACLQPDGRWHIVRQY